MQNFSELRVLHWNAGGLSQAKKTEVENRVNQKEIDVFSIVEANIDSKNRENFQFENFTMYIMEKSRQIASGILIGIRKSLTGKVSIIKEMGSGEDKIEIVKIEVWKNTNHFRIFSVYSPPGNKPNLDLMEIDVKTILMGDFNAHSNHWGYQDCNAAGKELIEYINTQQLQLIYDRADTPSYLHYNGSATNPDLVMVSADLAPDTRRRVLEDPGFGHRMILSIVKLKNRKKLLSKRDSKKSWNFKKARWKDFCDLLESEIKEVKINESSVDAVNRDVKNILLNVAKQTIPTCKTTRFKPFWNEDLNLLKTKRDSARKVAETTNKKEDVLTWRKLARDLKLEINKSKQETFNKFVSDIDYQKDGKKMYKFMSVLTNKHKKQSKQPIIVNNKQFTEDKDIANAFVKFYSNQLKKSSNIKFRERQIKIQMRKSYNTIIEKVFQSEFTIHELKRSIAKQKTRKSPGPDGIHVEFLKHLGPCSTQVILHLFNKIWSSEVPAEWKKAYILTIAKKNKDLSNMASYRPISLTSILCKIMERMVNDRLVYFLEANNLLSHVQAGFRKLQSTNQQVVRLSQAIKDTLDKSKSLVAVFIDFKSAYDKIWRLKLYRKLQLLGVNGKMFTWLRRLTEQRYIAVKYGNHTSKFRQSHVGLQQGGITSTTLFNVYINDLAQYLEKIEGIECALYADDLVLWTSDTHKKRHKMVNKLNVALKLISDWCDENEMEINTEKTVYQTFTLNRQPTEMPIEYKGSMLRESQNTKYLGVIFDKKLTWSKHVEEVTERVRERSVILKRLAGVRWGCSRNTLNLTYNMYIKPILTYCSEAMISCSKEVMMRLEVTQNAILRLITGAVKTTPIQAMLLLTNNKPIEEIIQQKALCLYEKLIRLPSNKYWRNYDLHQERRLKTQDGVMQKISKIKFELEIPSKPEDFPGPIDPMISSTEGRIHLNEEVQKKYTNDTILKTIALETISNTYPQSEWLHVYTDGSQFAQGENVGAGVFSSLFAYRTSLGPNATSFDGELEAIRLAVQHLTSRIEDFENAVILSDCIAAIQAVTSHNYADSTRLKDCINGLFFLKSKSKSIVLQWVPSHCGIFGNEMADMLAKKGTEIIQSPQNTIPYASSVRIIKNMMETNYKTKQLEEIEDKSWRNSLDQIPNFPRRHAVAAFRLETGHDCLAKYLFRFNLLPSPNCILCSTGNIMDLDHLKICPALVGNIYERYWSAREKMQNIQSG